MTTKNEFVEMWKHSKWLIRRIHIGEIYLFADDYQCLPETVELLRNNGAIVRIKYELIKEVE